jgi:hypothetical protein
MTNINEKNHLLNILMHTRFQPGIEGKKKKKKKKVHFSPSADILFYN